MNQQFFATTPTATYKVADFAADKISILGIRLGNETDGNLISIEMEREGAESEATFWDRASDFISEAVNEALGSTLSISSFSVSDDGTDSVVEVSATGHDMNGEKIINGKFFLIIAKDGSPIDSLAFEPTLLDGGNVVTSNSYLSQQNAINLGFSAS